MTNVALLVATTSNRYKNVDDLPLFKIFLPSFLKSINTNYTYIIYIGYDNGDPLYDIKNSEVTNKIINQIADHNVKLKYHNYENNVKSPCLIWNNLYKQAYMDGCDYFYQLGDDILFISNGWTDIFIDALKNSSVGTDIGVVGGWDINICKGLPIRLTQAFVSRKHYEIFGYLYPEVFKNWFSDDWITYVYQKYNLTICKHITLKNSGGHERYVVDHSAEHIFKEEIKRGEEKIEKYLSRII